MSPESSQTITTDCWISNCNFADKQGGFAPTPRSYIPHIPSQVIYSGSNEDYGFVTIKYAGWEEGGAGGTADGQRWHLS